MLLCLYSVHVCVHVCVYMCVHVCVCTCVYTCVCVHMCVYVCPGDSVEFLSWFLNALHTCLGGGTKKSKETVISRTFRGKLRTYSRKVPPIDMVRQRCTNVN